MVIRLLYGIDTFAFYCICIYFTFTPIVDNIPSSLFVLQIDEKIINIPANKIFQRCGKQSNENVYVF